jgi:hypothetical protein
VNRKSALPDFTLDGDNGSMDVYCLMDDTEDESASTYERVMKSKYCDKWLKAMNDDMKSIKSQKHLGADQVTRREEGHWKSKIQKER